VGEGGKERKREEKESKRKGIWEERAKTETMIERLKDRRRMSYFQAEQGTGLPHITHVRPRTTPHQPELSTTGLV
jgi:hypothetical protein